MNQQMEFEKTFEEFVETHSFKDTDRVYTNGIELITTFRVMQGWEHYRKQIREEVVDECIAEINKTCNSREDAVVYPHTVCNILEMLKEQKK